MFVLVITTSISCETLRKMSDEYPFTHMVLIDGEPLKKFRSLKEAKWFTSNKKDAIIKKLDVPKPKSIHELYEEAPF